VFFSLAKNGQISLSFMGQPLVSLDLKGKKKEFSPKANDGNKFHCQN
jgi:hypothetical protein